MIKKYYAPVSPVPVAVVRVLRYGREHSWFIGYRSSAKDSVYRHYGKMCLFNSEAEAQTVLDTYAKQENLKEAE